MVATTSLLPISIPQPVDNSYVVCGQVDAQVEVPKTRLAPGSLIVAPNSQPYNSWGRDAIRASYDQLQKIAACWKTAGTSEGYTTDQFMVYGRQHYSGSLAESFKWEIVPYYKSALGKLGRFIQQIMTLVRIVFGGTVASESSLQRTQSFYQANLPKNLVGSEISKTVQGVFKDEIGNDPFCNPDRIAKQRVLEGERVNVLYNYAPIGFGGERLHFLITPKAHKEGFTELSLEEYEEAVTLSKLLMDFYESSRKVHDVHLFHKTGVDAGQTVPHWHMHMIFTLSETQAFMGKLTVLKNMLFGSSPMNEKALSDRIAKLTEELNTVQRFANYIPQKTE